MRNHMRLIFGAVCLCLFTQIGFAEEVPQLVEKRAKSKSKVNVCIPSRPPCPPIPGPEGPEGSQGATGSCPCPCCPPCPTGSIGATGATGPTGPTGPTETCFQTYATVSVLGETGPIAPSPPDNAFTIPFNEQGPSSNNIELNETNHTVRIPVGIYKVWFQTMLVAEDVDDLTILKIFLRVHGTGDAQVDIPIDWVHSSSNNPYNSPNAAFGGEIILQITDPGESYPEVDVELIFEKTGSNSVTLDDPESDINSPAKLVLIKLDDLPPQV